MAYGFDADRLHVWLAPRGPDTDGLRAGVLCRRHAETLVVPRGWTLDDRREPTPRLFRAAPAASSATGPRSRRRRTPSPSPAQLPLTPDDDAAAAWVNRFDVEDDL